MSDVPEMVERVAQAIYAAQCSLPLRDKPNVERLRGVARAAIEALREPTDEMVIEGRKPIHARDCVSTNFPLVAHLEACGELSDWATGYGDFCSIPKGAAAHMTWRAMIDSALGKDTQT